MDFADPAQDTPRRNVNNGKRVRRKVRCRARPALRRARRVGRGTDVDKRLLPRPDRPDNDDVLQAPRQEDRPALRRGTARHALRVPVEDRRRRDTPTTPKPAEVPQRRAPGRVERKDTPRNRRCGTSRAIAPGAETRLTPSDAPPSRSPSQ